LASRWDDQFGTSVGIVTQEAFGVVNVKALLMVERN
jgi:hypothetical protein